MNLTMNNLNLSAAAAQTPAPVAAGDSAGAQPLQDLATAGMAQGAPAQPAFAFAQWLGLDQPAPVAADGAAVIDGEMNVDVAVPGADAPAVEQQTTIDNTLFGAMSVPMPLMPVAQATLAAMVASLPGVPAAKEARPAADTDVSLAAAGLPAVDGATKGTARDARGELAAASIPGALAPAVAVAPAAAAPVAPAQNAPAAAPRADATATLAEASQESSAGAGTERGAANTVGIAAPATGNAMRTADTVTLSGPPTAWRQTLQEALGERLQLQVGKNAEQAVIRLEPPMLGRVEIAIRHSAGSLEVHISATHGEVLRQLQSVGENLRNDLAQRQFTDVSVNIAAAPRGAAASANNLFAGDGSGRGRQQDGRQEEQNPGNALAEAHTGASPFSLNGRASA